MSQKQQINSQYVSLDDILKKSRCQVLVQSNPPKIVLIPKIVARCGTYIKDNLKTTGLFRITGSNKRVCLLQSRFEDNLDVDFDEFPECNVHDVTTLLKRFLYKLNEPIIPYSLYDSFRKPLLFVKNSYHLNINSNIIKLLPSSKISTILNSYKLLISKLSQNNQYLFLYLLDLINLINKNSSKNLMNSLNLSTIFQPTFIAHPKHNHLQEEFDFSRFVLQFLIENANIILPDMVNNIKETTSINSTKINSNNIVLSKKNYTWNRYINNLTNPTDLDLSRPRSMHHNVINWLKKDIKNVKQSVPLK